MNLNSFKSTPFTANLVRQTHPVFNKESKSIKLVETTHQDFIDSYDSQIKKLQEAKTRAIELDAFMRSEEVTELLEQLPEGDTVEIAANCSFSELDNEREVVWDNPYLMYSEDSIQEVAPQLSFAERTELAAIEVQQKNGSFDKEQVLNWLHTLINIFNK